MKFTRILLLLGTLLLAGAVAVSFAACNNQPSDETTAEAETTGETTSAETTAEDTTAPETTAEETTTEVQYITVFLKVQ